MKAIHLGYIIPLSIIVGFIFGFQAIIPDTITIETGENYVRVVEGFRNVSETIAESRCDIIQFTSKRLQYYNESAGTAIFKDCDDISIDFTEGSIFCANRHTSK